MGDRELREDVYNALCRIAENYSDRFKDPNEVVSFLLSLVFEKTAKKRLVIAIDFNLEDVSQILRKIYDQLDELIEKGEIKKILVETL